MNWSLQEFQSLDKKIQEQQEEKDKERRELFNQLKRGTVVLGFCAMTVFVMQFSLQCYCQAALW